MLTDHDSTDNPIAFAEKLLSLLDQGRFVATYKFAVLLALVDACLASTLPGGEAPREVTAGQLAERVVELYWRHTAPFDTRTGPAAAGAAVDPLVLRQNNGGQAEIVSLIRRFRERAGADPSLPLGRARIDEPEAFASLVRSVEWKLVEMPLPRLQLVGDRLDAFVYEIGWDERVTRAQFESPGFDSRLRLVGRAGDHLVRLAPLIRPLVEGRWALMVARLNPRETDEARLHAFLFGTERSSLEPVRAPLRELQDGRCFYCGSRLGARADVDHFVPWSRFHENAVENLVVACPACNGAKRDFLAAGLHVARWAERARPGSSPAGQLREIAAAARWESAPGRIAGVARATYLRLPDDALLWVAGRDFTAPDHALLAGALR